MFKKEIIEKEKKLLHLFCRHCKKVCVNFDTKCTFCNKKISIRAKRGR